MYVTDALVKKDRTSRAIAWPLSLGTLITIPAVGSPQSFSQEYASIELHSPNMQGKPKVWCVKQPVGSGDREEASKAARASRAGNRHS